MTFDEKLRAEAERHAKPHCENDESTWGAIDMSAFVHGARWAREETVQEICEWLQSAEMGSPASFRIMNLIIKKFWRKDE